MDFSALFPWISPKTSSRYLSQSETEKYFELSFNLLSFFRPGNTTLTYELEMFDIRPPPPQADLFSHIDANGDKKLSKKEISAYMKAQAQAQGMPVYDKRWKKHHKSVVANIFEHEDADEDGSISHDEFSGPKMMYHDEF